MPKGIPKWKSEGLPAPTSTPKTGEKPATEGVGRDEFVAFQNETRQFNEKVLDVLENLANKKESKREVPTDDAGPQGLPNYAPVAGNLNAGYREIFEKYFDPADGFTGNVDYPEIKNGKEVGALTFTITVPEKFSNMIDAAKQLYKVDKRTKVLDAGKMVEGIETWCEKVANNISYKKSLQSK